MKIEVYSDVVCPWCYIGERRLSRALAALPGRERVQVVFRPYQLDPRAPEAAVPFEQYMEGRFGRRAEGMLDSVNAAGRTEGISFAWNEALSANTRTAHRLLSWAEREYGAEVQRTLAERLFELHFTQGGNLASIDDLVAAASSAGIDAGRVRGHLASNEGVHELEAELDRARGLGIQAVPTFVIDGRYAVQGAQPVSTFVRVLEQALETAAPEASRDGEACTDGTCAVPPA